MIGWIGIIMCLFVSSLGALEELPPPQNLRAFSNLDSRVYLAWDPPAPAVLLVELYNDDGVPRGLDPGQPRDILSVRFTPSGACSLRSVKLFMFTPVRPDTIELHIWRDDGTGYPALFVGDLITPRRFVVSASYSWVEFDLSPYRIYLSGEDFHVGIVKVDTSLYYNVLVDGAPSVPPRSFLFSMRDFDFHTIMGDLMVRAVVKPLSAKSLPAAKRVQNFPIGFKSPIPYIPVFCPAILERSALLDYRIYRSTSPGGSFFLVGTTDSLYYDDLDVRNDSTYYYWVSAVYDGGESGYAGPVSATPRAGDGTIYDTLMYDSGVPSFAISWSPGYRMANRFSLPTIQKIVGIDCFIYARGMMRPGIYQIWGDVVDSTPVFILPSVDSVRTTGWHYIDIDRFNVYLSGDFLASINLYDASVAVGALHSSGARFSYDYDFLTRSWSVLPDTIYLIRVITSYSFSTVRVRLYPGWNMVSLPVLPENRSFSAIFPYAVPPAFRYNPITRSYARVDSLVEGEGYFVLSLDERTYEISGIPVRSYDIPVYRGWNMIGALSRPEPLSVSSIVAFPEAILADPRLYYFNTFLRRYESTTDLISGRGYYILSNGDGILRVRMRSE